jgi:hypothetical protein
LWRSDGSNRHYVVDTARVFPPEAPPKSVVCVMVPSDGGLSVVVVVLS